MSPALATYAVLALAVAFEVAATSLLNHSRQFTRPGPTILMALCYLAAFYLLSVAMKTMPMGVVYALWSGLGVVLISVVGLVAFGQRLDAAAVAGIALIVAGVAVLNLFSRTVPH